MKYLFGGDIVLARNFDDIICPLQNPGIEFATSIFIDKWGNVRRIHTGFSGPGTGKYYEEFVEDFNLFVNKLINEKSPPKNNDKEDATSETESVRP